MKLPIGISFFTFQAISYTIDVYYGKIEPQRKFTNIALYISLFPQLVAGPIVRYQTIEKEMNQRQFSWDDFTNGVIRFIIGLGKKVIIANTIANVADKVFSMNPADLSVSSAWLGVLAYAFQIYFDFSAYSDMAIGLGFMFGFYFLENFNLPYISRSISEFWRRWHISLSTWFRDYVYIPLGGNRVRNKSRLILNLFIVWLLTGLWHGANWTFVFWGLLFFVLIAFEKLFSLDKYFEKLPIIGNIYTMFFVLIGWVLFRSPDMRYAFGYVMAMFGLSSNPVWNQFSFYISREFIFTWLLCLLGSFGFTESVGRAFKNKSIWTDMLYFVYLFIVFILCLGNLSGGNSNPFIYFNF